MAEESLIPFLERNFNYLITYASVNILKFMSILMETAVATTKIVAEFITETPECY